MEKKIFALSYHVLSSEAEPKILYYYSSKKKALSALRARAKCYHVKVHDFAFYSETQIIYSGGEKFYYSVTEIPLL